MSEDPDVLSQWRAYGRPGNGYALGFDAIRLRRSLDPRGYFLAPCRYEQGQQEDLLNLIIETAFDEYHEREGAPGLDANQNRKVTGVSFGLLLLQAATLIKSPAFREEREWRLVRSGPETSISFRASPSMLVPYQVVEVGNDVETLPFARLVIGPTPHAAEEEAAANLLSHHLPTSAIDVTCSTIPFRAW